MKNTSLSITSLSIPGSALITHSLSRCPDVTLRKGQNLMNPCTFSYLPWWRGCESIFFTVFIFCWAMLSSSLMVIWTTNNDTIVWVWGHDMVKSSDFSRFGGYPCSTPFGVMTKRGITEISKVWDLKTSLKRYGI